MPYPIIFFGAMLAIIISCQMFLYLFRWYELSNRAYDPMQTWFGSIWWRRATPLRAFINECGYSFAYTIIWVFGWIIDLLRKDINGVNTSRFVKDKPAIVLIHGYMARSSHFRFFRLRMWLKGVPNGVTFDYSRQSGACIEDYRKLLREFILKFRDKTGIHNIIFIGHSFGGLLAIDYALEYQDTDGIKGVIALASPIRGSRLATLALTRLGRTFHPTNPDLKRLIDSKIDAPLYSIFSRYDQLVLPYTNSEHPQAIENVELMTCGHSGFYFNAEVFRATYKRLEPMLGENEEQK